MKKAKAYKCHKIVLAVPKEDRTGEPGYQVTYEDGYVSWSPKKVFEAGYSELKED